ncbi:MAG: endolytic transglycosylase MltG [Spirochaetaceae bacterium]|jgi:UPF0755 protein|nr:endolytic transglycosylase MltG [Spirochaetaceae bacterium]
MKKPVKICLITLSSLLVLLLMAAGAGFFLFTRFEEPPSSASTAEPVVFVVNRGESARAVGRRLEEAGLIRSHYVWDILARLNTAYLKAGTYRLNTGLSQQEIQDILIEGKQQLYPVTIPEGSTLKKTAALFAEKGICTAADFLAAAANPAIISRYHIPGSTMEGFLYPDTYFFEKPYSAEAVVRHLADTFFIKLGEINIKTSGEGALSPEEIYEKVIIASIVEREYRAADEAPLMAGVFEKRLAIGMPLQSCATVEYIITEIEGKAHPKTIYTADTEINNPYNTYRFKGLPPGPISEPGLVALKAAFFPAKTDYLYFRLVNAEEGRHYFSTTFDQHIKAAAFYIKN